MSALLKAKRVERFARENFSVTLRVLARVNEAIERLSKGEE